jgi:hypothetical protein
MGLFEKSEAGRILPEQSLDPAERWAAVPKRIRKPKRLSGENVVGSNERRKANPWSATEWTHSLYGGERQLSPG